MFHFIIHNYLVATMFYLPTQTRGSEKLRSILSEKASERTSGDVDVVSAVWELDQGYRKTR